jgi:hypothetical protein
MQNKIKKHCHFITAIGRPALSTLAIEEAIWVYYQTALNTLRGEAGTPSW